MRVTRCICAMGVVAAWVLASGTAHCAQPSRAEQGFDERGRVSNLNKWFLTLPLRLNKDKAKGLDALYHFSISGPQGGQWWLRVKDQKAYVSAIAPKNKPTCNVRASDNNWLKIVNGELKAATAYVTFRLRIGGNKAHAKAFSRLFF